MTSAMLPVRGRSRRDMEHGECRGVPRDGLESWDVFGCSQSPKGHIGWSWIHDDKVMIDWMVKSTINIHELSSTGAMAEVMETAMPVTLLQPSANFQVSLSKISEGTQLNEIERFKIHGDVSTQ